MLNTNRSSLSRTLYCESGLCLALQTAAKAEQKAACVREKHAAVELAKLRKDAAKQDSTSAKLEKVLLVSIRCTRSRPSHALISPWFWIACSRMHCLYLSLQSLSAI